MTASAAIGNATHLVWDGVTHSEGAIARRVAALTVPYDVPVLGSMALHRIIQHASSVVGTPVAPGARRGSQRTAVARAGRLCGRDRRGTRGRCFTGYR